MDASEGLKNKIRLDDGELRGFELIYSHDEFAWACLWRPCLVASLTMALHMSALVLPVVTEAQPDFVKCGDDILELGDACQSKCNTSRASPHMRRC